MRCKFLLRATAIGEDARWAHRWCSDNSETNDVPHDVKHAAGLVAGDATLDALITLGRELSNSAFFSHTIW